MSRKEGLRCPAEESANSERLQLINVKRNSEKIGTRINNVLFWRAAVFTAVLFFLNEAAKAELKIRRLYASR
jgi:hypothetical protein